MQRHFEEGGYGLRKGRPNPAQGIVLGGRWSVYPTPSALRMNLRTSEPAWNMFPDSQGVALG